MKRLFEPLVIGKLKLKNRVVMAPMCTNYGTLDGYVTKRLIDYYVARAKGGAGLIQVEAVIVDFPEGRCLEYHLSIDDDCYLYGLKQLAEALHKASPDVKVSVQLHDAGGQSDPSLTGCQTRSASSISTHEIYKTPPREMTVAEIQTNVRKWAEAAARAKKAGFDAVNIHFGHGYLVGNFLSPLTNKRTDDYGGSFENRSRLAREILRACREAVGSDYPCIVRINSWDMIEGGMSLEEGKELARMCVDLGADIIDVSGGVRGSDHPDADCTMAGEDMVWVKYAQEIKEIVAPVPVIAVRKIMTPENAEKVLETTDIDLVAFGRPWLAEPELALKAQEGRMEEIIPCIACNQGCFEYLWAQMPITCMVNPATGREAELELTSALDKKKVLVVGGGPAGAEAARVLKLRGHEVSLYEKEEELGGQLKMACRAAYRQGFKVMIDYFERTIRRLGVQVYTGVAVTPEVVKEHQPEVVIIATGPRFHVPLPVTGGVSMEDIYRGKPVEGQKVVIQCIGTCCSQGTFYGCDLAETLAKEGKEVTVITPKQDIIENMGVYRRRHERRRIKELGINYITKARVTSSNQGHVTTVSAKGEELTLPCDTLILGIKPKPDHSLFETIRVLVPESYLVGDAAEIGNALLAVRRASELARFI